MLRLFTGVVIGVIFAEPLRDAAKKSWNWFKSDNDEQNKGDEQNKENVAPHI